MKVLFIAGWGRSGSTLLADLLGNCKDFFCIGEFRLWARRYRENYLCGCGSAFRECHVWGKIFDEAFGKRSAVDIDRISGPQTILPCSWNHIKGFETLLSKITDEITR